MCLKKVSISGLVMQISGIVNPSAGGTALGVMLLDGDVGYRFMLVPVLLCR